MIAEEVKEVQMEVAQEGGGGGTRKRRGGGGRRRRTRAPDTQEGGAAVEVGVERVEAPAPAPVGRELAPVAQAGGAAPGRKAPAAAPPVVVIAPAKKKPAKVMLVPKSAVGVPRPVAKKTFKARKVRVSIDNSAKTVKRRRSVLSKIEAMTEEQLRAKAVAIKLSRPETVAKVPVTLLRQMIKDYYTMRGSFL